MLPSHFCWTRFGTEAGESIGSILERKEKERLAAGGMFLWGIGNSVGPAIRELILLETRPMVVFSPMRSKPKVIDVAPSSVVEWTSALDLDGLDWPIPQGIRVTSRQGSEGGREKRAHFALVCKSTLPLAVSGDSCSGLIYQRLVNLKSLNKLGASQVTAVVKHLEQASMDGIRYPVAFAAELVYPYFVRLENPVGAHRKQRVSSEFGRQASLLAA